MKVEEYIRKRKQQLLEANHRLHLQLEKLYSERDAVESYIRQSEQSADLGHDLFFVSVGDSVRERRNELHARLDRIQDELRGVEHTKKEVEAELEEINAVEEEIHSFMQ